MKIGELFTWHLGNLLRSSRFLEINFDETFTAEDFMFATVAMERNFSIRAEHQTESFIHNRVHFRPSDCDRHISSINDVRVRERTGGLV